MPPHTNTLSPATRSGGMALMIGVALVFVASILYPGGLLIDPVDPTDFVAAIEVMADYPSLSHLLTMLIIIGMVLHAYGSFGLLGLSRKPGLGDTVLRFGIAVALFEWSIFVVAMGMRHFVIHLMQRGMDAPPLLQAGFEGLALNTYVAMAGVILALVAVYPISTILVGVGLARRFRSMSIFKLASHVLTIIGVGGFVNYLVLQLASGADPTTLLVSHNILLWIGSICLFIIGWGMYQGKSELTSAD